MPESPNPEPRLPELESALGERFRDSAFQPPLGEDDRARVRAAFRRGAAHPRVIALRIEAFPLTALAFVDAIGAAGPFWTVLEQETLGGRSIAPSDHIAIRKALAAALEKTGAGLGPTPRLLAGVHGFHSFSARSENDGRRLEITASWFGPVPDSFELVLFNESRPWRPTVKVPCPTTGLTDGGDAVELMVELDERLEPGRYDLIARSPRLGSWILSRDETLATATVSCGTEDELESVVAGEEHATAKTLFQASIGGLSERGAPFRKILRRALPEVLEREGGLKVLLDIVLNTRRAPEGCRGGELHDGLMETLRKSRHQAGLLDLVGADEERIAAMAALGLPSITAPPEALRGRPIEPWSAVHSYNAALPVLGAGGDATAALRALLGPVVDAWSDSDGAAETSERLTLVFRGRDYDFRVDHISGARLEGVLTTADEEEVECVLEEVDEGHKLYPNPSASGRLFDILEVLVNDPAEYARMVGESIRHGVPVMPGRPVTPTLRRPRRRPGPERFLEGVADARRLALANSRRISAEATDQGMLQELLRFDGPLLDPAAYGRAMLEWALPLSCDDRWKERLWAIDREARGLESVTEDLRRRGFERAPTAAVGLVRALESRYRSDKSSPAPLALERAMLGFAIEARTLARLPADQVPEEVSTAIAGLEALARTVCPTLLGWFVVQVELILTDGAAE